MGQAKFRNRNSETQFWAWLAGLIDGEGSFAIQHDKRPPERYRTNLAVALRADDWRTLEYVRDQSRIGSLRYTPPGAGSRPQANPVSVWQVSRLDHLLYFIDRIDTLGGGLRSKKARDYEIWKQATLLIDKYTGGKHSEVVEQLAHLKERLQETRRWSEELAEGASGAVGRTADGIDARSLPREGRTSKAFWASPAAAPQKLLRQKLYSRLTQEQIEEIVARVLAGERRVEIAAEFGVSRQLVDRFLRGGVARRDGTLSKMDDRSVGLRPSDPEFWKTEAGQRAHQNQARLRGKLTQQQIDQLVERNKNGESAYSLAKEYGISKPLALKFIKGNYIRRD